MAIATVFPDLFSSFLNTGVIGRGLEKGIASVEMYDIRDHPVDQRGSVDDYQFGGGAGMVLRPEPLFDTLEDVSWREGARVAMMTPQGRPLDTAYARDLAESKKLIVFCGRYGGVDERFRQTAVTDEICVGDAVVSGGEIPAMYLIEAVFRWLPGVLGRLESARSDSFATGLLDYPRYTRPAEFRGMKVPEELTSGNHALIAQWRFRAAMTKTRKVRPDLLVNCDEKITEERFAEIMKEADRAKEQDNG
ncbi:MAG: tRNA (guanosine(37)-N1)-methyltransferase TrmD [Candidatus Sabulitectum sp.]|nr:tRNA (guanosine(37)-N1)-methyltransferase TrmD [Candidatus Sabulitectum sp.]